ncbi:MAG TPA: AbrB/MazE/SpoVT family DNA-binding domain-containing protein [Pyrinomonadaceae bacterium]|nr:AbrB/MazE/SpoVT family DNA-binding domain-containing protein [Pyrinomonadaceae bacterium]
MKTNIVTIGNSQGIRIPKILLEQSKLSKEVELEVRGESIVILPARKPRDGWGEMFQSALAAGETDDTEEFADWDANSLTHFDGEEW